MLLEVFRGGMVSSYLYMKPSHITKTNFSRDLCFKRNVKASTRKRLRNMENDVKMKLPKKGKHILYRSKNVVHFFL